MLGRLKGFVFTAFANYSPKLVNNSRREPAKEIITTAKEVSDPLLICIDFGDFLPSFSTHLVIRLRSYIKHSKECFIRYPNTLKWV